MARRNNWHPNNLYPIVLGGVALVQGVQWVIADRVFAHDGPHGNVDEQATDDDSSSSHAQTSETTQATESAEQDPATMPSTSSQLGHENIAAPIEEIPVSPNAPIASNPKNNTSNILSIGLGESIFGLMIVAPFLLVSLKKQLQS